ncbi:MFS transporter [Halomarina litorea]|uniref:MFS transporter n=1 Tax=Halomarina litorea TaxID=2961595 RepID=UPI0020C33720|nr:MFS transporter [Halomarina sp. BCD28]
MVSLGTLFGADAAVLRDREFQLLLLVNVSPPLGTALVSPLLDTLTGTYGVSEAEIGLMVTAFTAPSIFLIPLIGLLADRYGRKAVMLAGLLLFGAGGAGLAFTTDFGAVLALRFVQGVGFGGLTPVIVASIGDLYDGGAEATAQGLRFAASGLTLMTLPLLGGLLVAVAWYVPFALYLVPFPVAVLLYLFFEEPSREETDGEGGENAGGSVGELLSLLRQPRVAAVLVGRSVPNFAYIAFLTYNSFIVVRAVGGTPEQAGLLVAVTSVAHTVAATQAGRVTERFDSRLYPLMGGALALGGGLALLGLAPTLPVVLAAGGVVGLGFGLSLSLYRSVITGLAPTALRGGVVSAGASLGRAAATVAPLAMGLTVGLTQDSLGFVVAVRWTVAGVGVLCAGVGVLVLVVAHVSPPVEYAVRGVAVSED